MLSHLESLIRDHPRLVVLTGAGVSAPSGIPTYRNDDGEWQRSDPIQHQDFLRLPEARQRYWARSMAGWRFVADSRPNRAHRALVDMESTGFIDLLATQNVDRLHQQAGQRRVIDLHGRLDRVRCLDCGEDLSRATLQDTLQTLNPGWHSEIIEKRPDGDAEVDDEAVARFQVPNCDSCKGTLMPDVVFFGGTVPRARVERISGAIESSSALLIVGSSLSVFSGFRFCRQAHRLGKPIGIINRGSTRADEMATVKVSEDCESSLVQLARSLGKASASVL
jgi:NAD-dependent SIR2 family protein deacetylase